MITVEIIELFPPSGRCRRTELCAMERNCTTRIRSVDPAEHGFQLDPRRLAALSYRTLRVDYRGITAIRLRLYVQNCESRIVGEVLDRAYEFYKRAGFRRELVTSKPGLQGMLNFLTESIPEATNAKPAQFFDTASCAK